jgi:hypothetical protein
MSVNHFDTDGSEVWSIRNGNKFFKNIHTKNPDADFPIGLDIIVIKPGANARLRAYAKKAVPEGNPPEFRADIHLESWDDTKLDGAGCSWLDVNHGPDFEWGVYETGEMIQLKLQQIHFKNTYTTIPKVIVWLNTIDADSGDVTRIKAEVHEVTTTGFTLKASTWSHSQWYNAALTWIAVNSSRPYVEVGQFTTSERNSDGNYTQMVKFEQKFIRPPRVAVAFNHLDISKQKLRIHVSATDITTEGMKLVIGHWADTVIYQAGVAFIALDHEE